MTQQERRVFLIEELLKEQPLQLHNKEIPEDEYQQKRLLRALFNIRMPKEISSDFIRIQDEYLQESIALKGVTDYKNLNPTEDGIYLWQGDITTLKCGGIVNAANSQMLGCFCPNHGCIDNAIHTYAGIQLRAACAELMGKQNCLEPTGGAKITPAFNLPCDYVLHTVGPIITGRLTNKDCELLKSCYLSCLELATENKIQSIVFCCISTGEFRFPNEKAAEIAVNTVREYKKHSEIEVIFNVFKTEDYEIYKKLLG